MPSYVFAYKGGGGMAPSPEAQKAAMEAWGKWFGSLGSAVVDGGNPFGKAKSVGAGGDVKDGTASSLTGYSVVKADTIDAATTIAKGCPVLKNGGTVEVYETMPM